MNPNKPVFCIFLKQYEPLQINGFRALSASEILGTTRRIVPKVVPAVSMAPQSPSRLPDGLFVIHNLGELTGSCPKMVMDTAVRNHFLTASLPVVVGLLSPLDDTSKQKKSAL